ncbi:MAG: DNA gyrase inhibitor YacG [Sphingobium phenoxybenzoativorans]
MPNKTHDCSVCGKPQTQEQRPFCSTACRDRDLLQWLGEGYRVPGRPVANESGDHENDED